MQFKDIGMIAADTSRSKTYIQALARNEMLPAYVLLLEHDSKNLLPGQQKISNKPKSVITETAPCWSEADFDSNKSLRALLDDFEIPYEVSPSTNVNDLPVIELLKSRPENVFIFSGFGGVLLRKAILDCGKNFLHVHGGFLPDYKGSTTNYYSLIEEGKMGASAIFLNEAIDSGPILLRKKFPPPADPEKIDHVYDSAARAKVLVDVLTKYKASKKWEFDLPNNEGGETFYIIHPVLKHIAILSRGRKD